MTINERVKYFRKDILHISQTEFATSLGMKQTGVSYMERDGSTVTEQTIKSICLLYNVNEDWLRYGTKPIYIQQPTFSLDDFVKSKGATDSELEIVIAYFELDKDIRKTLIDHFRHHLHKHDEKANLFPDIPDTVEEFEEKFETEDLQDKANSN